MTKNVDAITPVGSIYAEAILDSGWALGFEIVPMSAEVTDKTHSRTDVSIAASGEGVTGTNYNDDASNWFDGDTSNAASLYSGNMVAPYSRTTVVFTPPSPITVSTGGYLPNHHLVPCP